MKAQALLAVLSTLASASASALPPVRGALSGQQHVDDNQPGTWQRRDDENQEKDYSKNCPVSIVGEREGKAIWSQEGAGKLVDEFIRTQDLKGRTWLKAFEAWVLDLGGPTEADGCSQITDECDVGKIGWECRDYYREADARGKPELGPAFWVFKAVKGFHNIMRAYDWELDKRAFETGFDMDHIIEAFGANDVEEKMPDWVAASFGLIGGGVGRFPGLGDHWGIIGDVLSSASEDPKDVTGDLQNQLKEVFKHQKEGLKRHLSVVMGHGTSEETAALHGFDEFESPIANYLNVGVWLAEIDEVSVGPVAPPYYDVETGEWVYPEDNPGPQTDEDILRDLNSTVQATIVDALDQLEGKIASEAMREAGWVVVLDHERNNKTLCEKEGGDSSFLLRGEDNHEFCIELYHKKPASFVEAADDEFLGLMAEHGITKLERYYKAITDCFDYGDYDATLEWNVVDSFRIPRCYFWLPMYDIKYRRPCGSGRRHCIDDLTPIERHGQGA